LFPAYRFQFKTDVHVFRIFPENDHVHLLRSFTGLGTPGKYRTGRTQAYRSRIILSATLRLRIPSPTGVVNGPLMPTRYS